MSNPPRRPWIVAMDALARRQRRLMVAAALVWVVLAIAQALGVAWLWAYGGSGIAGWASSPAFPWQITISGVHCYPGYCHFGCRAFDGLRSSLWTWAAAALLPLLVVPPRRRAPSPAFTPDALASPYREGLPAVGAAPDEPTRVRSRRARRALFAVASVSWLLIHAHWQAVIIGPAPAHVTVNGVAVLELLVALSVVLAYVAAARWPRRTPSPRG